MTLDYGFSEWYAINRHPGLFFFLVIGKGTRSVRPFLLADSDGTHCTGLGPDDTGNRLDLWMSSSKIEYLIVKKVGCGYRVPPHPLFILGDQYVKYLKTIY